jgi:hypothetical protein
MLANVEMNLSWSELMKRTARETMSDDGQRLASQLASRARNRTRA